MPSKKVISIFIICAGLVATIIIISNRNNIPTNLNLQTVSGLSGKSPEVAIGENPNWQSDVSAVSAGAEIPEQASSTDPNNSSETLTDTLSRSLMANYLSIKKSGPLTDTDATKLVNQSVDFIDKTNTKQYTLADIVVSPDNSKASLTKYGNDLGLIAKTDKQSLGTGSEIGIYSQMVASQSSDGKLQLISISKDYKTLATSLSKVVVPSSFSVRQLAVINALNAIADSVVDLSYAIDDPTRSLRAIGTYKDNYNIFTDQVRQTKVDLVNAGVSYKQGENGYYFFFGI